MKHQDTAESLHQEIVERSISDFTSLSLMKDYRPSVTIEFQYMTYYSSRFDDTVYYYPTYQEADTARKYPKNNNSGSRSRQYGVQVHYSETPVFHCAGYDLFTGQYETFVLIDKNQLFDHVEISYRKLRNIEYMIADLVGFQTMHQALQHQYIQHMLQCFTVHEIWSLRHLNIYRKVTEVYNEAYISIAQKYYYLEDYPDRGDYEEYTAERKKAFSNYVQEEGVKLNDQRRIEYCRIVFHEIYQRIMDATDQEVNIPFAWIQSLLHDSMHDIYPQIEESAAKYQEEVLLLAQQATLGVGDLEATF